MGSMGSGSWYRWNKKSTDENFWRFSMAALKKYRVIGERKRASGNWQWLCNGEVRSSISYTINTLEAPEKLNVRYSDKHSEQAYNYDIRLTTTQPHFGGERWWFLCPVRGCGKRVSVLYMADILACRHCLDFTYSSQNEAPMFRLLHKAQAIHQKLGGSGVVDEPLIKPKGMHWKTFHRMTEEMFAYYDSSLRASAARFGMDAYC